MLKCSSVSVSFGGLKAVDDVSFNVKKNEILGMIGPNGAGKTTLFNAICGDVRNAGGEIIFEGKSLSNLTKDLRCRQGIARTFQIPQLFENLSVRENVLIGALCKESQMSEALAVTERVLRSVKIEKLADLYPDVLTIGQRKSLELARALATQPDLILLDEIMGGLHVNEVEETVALLKEIRQQGVTVFLIEHVISAVVSLCDRVVVMNQGKLIAEGTAAEVMSDHEVIDAYLGREDDA
ncbi:ABC transporter ATP-binding protein [Desulfitobacterium chlororespirans]|uniref:Branched-chain amino acid transport system ATP-binding protein n=1 Tax=Desulfitobacterium chlororespirans DSM 11544 TaxID=1121395 RepID=A0A1M7UGA3_9FIRM|nr:ABC transporter ATP-binding protein [Desulfitobacterium chlororespirans]SHN81935.1 branched-chain amino acid transport system ATP-binding protein [Desulfitobacterium chlororespirans DSM 11544]